MAIRYVILNGPSGSGKSTMAVELIRALSGMVDPTRDIVVGDSFAAPIKHFIAAALSEKYHQMDKEKPRSELNGHSVRQSLIMLAEDHCKAVYGNDIFGKWLIHRSLKYPYKVPKYVVIDDGGFPAEIDALPNKFVVKVTRPGKDFSGDSRGYYDEPHWCVSNCDNLATLWGSMKILAVHLERWTWQ